MAVVHQHCRQVEKDKVEDRGKCKVEMTPKESDKGSEVEALGIQEEEEAEVEGIVEEQEEEWETKALAKTPTN
ncbi:uncharacterized protein ACA1_085260 [Acanthamoeba castellanii str. Neff]|uniref:Uncharacterized protein n=1 Tax=Acanthamoeba castellanii (strain ATCC 30010 / Neff) TaxID=1257118 RepID=L8HKF2_ACACF|nr:uncharacterized protein ACA1_085260 [Acanthamoeba castellanii str. Neff]ELR25697.1 hypothetical protein ACA1_085260 [Acanthamoeba castellanii str. Neff]